MSHVPSAQTLRTNNNLAFSFYLCYTFILHICRLNNSFDKMRLHILSLFDTPANKCCLHNASLLSGSALFLLPFAYSPHRFHTCIFKAKKNHRSLIHPQFTQFLIFKPSNKSLLSLRISKKEASILMTNVFPNL